MRSRRTEPWGHLGTQIGGIALVLGVVSGWIVWRVHSASPPPTRPRVEATVLAQAPPASASVTIAIEPPLSAPMTEGPAMDADPDPGPPLAIGSPDPELDKLVEKATPREPVRGEVIDLAPIVRKANRRTPATVAADVDAAIDRKLAAATIPASPPADDAEFLRRAYLDLIGVIPTITRTKSFLADRTPDKRARLVEELLTDPQYGHHFAHYWHDLLVKRDPDNIAGIKTHDVFLKWLAHQFNVNRPWDETVRVMLTATGDPALAGETFFILANSDNGQPAANKIVGTAAALFLGNQLMCAECHVHPNNKDWRQQDFWGLAAFFRKTRADRPKSKNPNDVLARITDDPAAPPRKKGAVEPAPELFGGAIAIPDPRNEGQYIGAARPAFMGGKTVDRMRATRKVAAEWFTAADNPYFARAAVNRVWSKFFGRGFVNPLDDIRPDSEVVHGDVLQLLAEEFVASRFDLKHLMRCITSTRAYQRTSRTIPANADDQELYSHMALKVLPPRALFRSLAVATGEKIKGPGEDAPPTKKNETPRIGLGFFDSREYDESPIEYTYGVPQLLRLLNALLPPACDAMAVVANRQGGTNQAVEHLYLTTLSRRPTAAEITRAADFVARQREPVKGYSTLAWALLSGAEFVNNH